LSVASVVFFVPQIVDSERRAVMPEKVKQYVADLHGNMAKVKARIPNAVAGFGGLFQKVMTDGALSLKHKELVALGIAVAKHCEPCIYIHVQKALESGCTPDEVMEAASVAVVMGGGPAYTHLPMVERAIQAFAK